MIHSDFVILSVILSVSITVALRLAYLNLSATKTKPKMAPGETALRSLLDNIVLDAQKRGERDMYISGELFNQIGRVPDFIRTMGVLANLPHFPGVRIPLFIYKDIAFYLKDEA